METIILAGGLGTRLKSLVNDIPKPMADIHGRPFLSCVMDFLSGQGISRVLLSVGYKHELIERYFGPLHGRLKIEYVVEHEPLGTGGAILESLRSCHEDDVVVLNGDTLFTVDLPKMMEFHRLKRADITVALKALVRTGRYGAVHADQNGRITGFHEKADEGTDYINGGVYILRRGIENLLRRAGRSFSFESDFLERNVRRISAYAFVSDAFFIDIGIPSDYIRAREVLSRAVKGVVP